MNVVLYQQSKGYKKRMTEVLNKAAEKRILLEDNL